MQACPQAIPCIFTPQQIFPWFHNLFIECWLGSVHLRFWRAYRRKQGFDTSCFGKTRPSTLVIHPLRLAHLSQPGCWKAQIEIQMDHYSSEPSESRSTDIFCPIKR